jgi:iron complex transport system ATP-binding protein
MSTLAARDLQVRLGGTQALAGVGLTLAPRQVTAVVGPNGAGKSTLLACLAGLRAPDRGAVTLDGTDLFALPPRRRAQRIGFLPQNPEIAWGVEAQTLVGLGRTPFIGARGPSAEDEAAVARAMAATRTAGLARRNVLTLSGGERARVLIARALAGAPRWLLADEPLTGLDPGFQLDTAELFRQLAHAQGCGVVLTLHDLSMALRVADRVLVLARGRILADDAPAAALSPAVLAAAYGVAARFVPGAHGLLIEIMGRSSENPEQAG